MPRSDDTSDSDAGSNDGKQEENSQRHSTLELDEDRNNGIETPQTQVTEVPLKPDISIFSKKTKCYIDIRDLREHRVYLQALATLKYKDPKRPEDIGKLFHRRNNLLKQLRSKVDCDDVIDTKEVEKINEAYEVLKSNLDQTFESHRRVRKTVDTNVRGISLNCSPHCVQALGICSSDNEKWKNLMEDTRVYQDCFGGDATKCFMGIYDGHHGKFAAEV